MNFRLTLVDDIPITIVPNKTRNMATENILTKEITQIKIRFLLKLEESLTIFQAFRHSLKNEEIDNFQLEETSNRIHKIAGSAEIFGFAHLGDLAVELENQLKQKLSKEEMLTLSADLNLFIQEVDIILDKNAKEKKDIVFNTEDENNKYHILIAEDNDLMRDLIAKSLRDKGCCVYETKDGDDVLKMAKVLQTVDLILLDINMPKKDGFEVIQLLKEDATLCQIPVTMLTRRTNGEDVIRALSYGAKDYITKPFRVEEMVKRVMDFLNNMQEKTHL